MMDYDPKHLVESGYDHVAQRYLEFTQRDLQTDKPSARMHYLGKLLKRLPMQAEVLELGCGAGVPCTQLLAQQAHVTGVDISAAQIALARQNVPTFSTQTFTFLKHVQTYLSEGKHVAFHCRQGLGRAALMAASVLVISGLPPERAYDLLTKARGYIVPETEEQRAWVVAFFQYWNTSML